MLFRSTLKELWQQVAGKKSCEAKQKELTAQRDTLADRLKKLEKSKLAEQADVDRLEGHSLAAFFYQVIGKMDEKMDKERQEAYAARVKYDAALHDLSSVDADLEQIQNRLERLSDCERQYQATLSEKIKSIKASAHPAAQQVAESESRIAALKVQKRELLEAINAGKTALHTVNEVLETLDNAEGWSTWDVMGGGLMADLAKYEELDDAQEQIEQLQVELRRFKTELSDVEITADLQVTVDSFLKFADFFFDGLFADWAVLDHINQAQSRVENTKGQIKRVLAASWGVQVMAITAISAALGLGRLIALPFAGPLSDKLGRRISTAIGSGSYAIYLIGLALAFNAGTHGGYQIAYICAIIGGIANSFLDTGIYPAVSEIIYKAPGVATMGIKFFIAIAQMLLPFVLGMTVATTAAGLTSYNTLFFGCGIIYIVLLVLVMIFPLPDSDAKAEGKKEGLIASLKHTHFSVESIAMIIIGFTCTGTFQLWLNCAQNFAKENVGWADPSVMQSYYSAGTMIALIVTALLTRKIKDVRFILVYPVICLATMVVVLVGQTKPLMIAGAFIIGWAGAGGLLQIVTSVCNMLFPKIKGTVTALVMIASSLCNYTILTAASKMQPSQVMVMNIVLTAIGVVLGLFVNLRYTKMVELSKED